MTKIDDLDEALEELGLLESMWINAPFGMLFCNSAGRFVKANPYVQAALGRTEEDLKSRSFMSLVHPEDVVSTRQAWEIGQEKRKKGDFSQVHLGLNGFKNRYIKSDGSVVHLVWIPAYGVINKKLDVFSAFFYVEKEEKP